MDQASREFVEKYSPNDSAQQLRLLSDLHDRGKLTDAEFAEEKTRVLDAARAHDAPAGATGPTAPSDPARPPADGSARPARSRRPRVPATRPDPARRRDRRAERAARRPRGFGA